MNLNIKLSEEQMMERQKNIARLKENKWIQIFLEQNHLDASFVCLLYTSDAADD